MKLVNSLEYPDHFLRRMVSWCCGELDLPVRYVREAAFRKSRSPTHWCGRAMYGSRSIGIRLGESIKYPTRSRYTRQDGAVTYDLCDRMEVLLHIVAHELAHLRHKYSRATHGGHEQSIDRRALVVLTEFRARRDALMSAWSAPPAEKPAKPKASVIDKRADAAAKALSAWQRKAKLAATKIKKYKAKVRYYERRAATNAATSTESNA